MSGPLSGVVVVEVGGIGPGPFGGMILSDLGARVIRVDRPGAALPLPLPAEDDLANRGKEQVALDLKRPEAVEALLTLVEHADILIEGFRPGVAERIGFGPSECLERNPRLVYGRMTGWGQDGPWAQAAGHDINYVSATGALHAIGAAGGPPQIPLNLVGDFAGGSCYLVMGVLAALLEARTSGRGQVVDAAIVDGVSHLLTGTLSFLNGGIWRDQRGVNILDGGAPFYRVYETADGRHVAVGCIEPQFWAEMLAILGIEADAAGDRNDPSSWPGWHALLEQTFASRDLAAWSEAFDGTDACVSAVISLHEAPAQVHLGARGAITAHDGRLIPAPAPRFSRSVPDPAPTRAPFGGSDTETVLREFGIDVAAVLGDGACATR